MVKVRTLVPLEDEDGPIGLGQVVDVSDEQAAAWRAAGKVSVIADEERNAQAAGGVYDAVTGRDDVAQVDPKAPSGGPQDDTPKPKGKK